jgi:hypothetical protein
MDVSLAAFVVFLHVVTAFFLVAGLIGRGIVLGRARRSSDLQEIDILLPVADRFEKIVIPSSGVILVLGLLAMWRRIVPCSRTASTGSSRRWCSTCRSCRWSR